MTAAGRPAAVLKQAVTDDSKFGYSSSCLFGYTPLMRTVNQCHASVRARVRVRAHVYVRAHVRAGGQAVLHGHHNAWGHACAHAGVSMRVHA